MPIKRTMLVDQKSYDLAEHFLGEMGAHKDAIQGLAEDIQQACESACREYAEGRERGRVFSEKLNEYLRQERCKQEK